MKFHRRKGKKVTETLTLLWGSGLAITFFIATLIPSWNKYIELYYFDQVHFFLSAILAFTTFILFILYAIASHYEMTMLSQYLEEESVKRVRPHTYIVIFALAIFFGILITISDKILYYSSFIVIYNLLDMWGVWQLLKTLRTLIDKELKKELPKNIKDIINAIDFYYFKNPHLQRIVTILFFNWIALALAIISKYEKAPFSYYARNSSYIIIILNIIIWEFVIYGWRKKRDRAIEKAEV